jgi:hypothetical protein
VLGLKYFAAALAALLAAASGLAAAQGIYTCVDSKGRRHTADRPIVACIDREQVEMSAGGLAKRTIAPTQTAVERAAAEAKAGQEAEERGRAEDQKKRERALVTRYPDRDLHDRERAEALALVDSVTATAQNRIEALMSQRRLLDGEVEFYKIDPSRMPAKLKRQIVEVDQQLAAQQRFVIDQEQVKVKVNARFDEGLARLKALWAQNSAAAVATVARAASSAAASSEPAAAPSAARLVPRR